jgi:hypothetical protein
MLNSKLESPYALIRRGGIQTTGMAYERYPDGLPCTRMAYLIMRDDNSDGYLAYIGNDDLKGWTKHMRKVAQNDIIARWDSPTLSEIKKAKKAFRAACMGGEPLTPEQTTLLQKTDAFLQGVVGSIAKQEQR